MHRHYYAILFHLLSTHGNDSKRMKKASNYSWYDRSLRYRFMSTCIFGNTMWMRLNCHVHQMSSYRAEKGGLFKVAVSQIATIFNSLFYFLSSQEGWIGRIYRIHCMGVHCILRILHAILNFLIVRGFVEHYINVMQPVYNF